MPRISAFYGVTIWMYRDEGAHARRRFHARYGKYQAPVDFHGDVVVGWLPPCAFGFVADWALLHADELQAKWGRARGISPFSRSSRWPSMECNPLVDVVAVEVIGDHRLRLSFEDGTVGDVAFGDREWRGVFEPRVSTRFGERRLQT